MYLEELIMVKELAEFIVYPVVGAAWGVWDGIKFAKSEPSRIKSTTYRNDLAIDEFGNLSGQESGRIIWQGNTSLVTRYFAWMKPAALGTALTLGLERFIDTPASIPESVGKGALMAAWYQVARELTVKLTTNTSKINADLRGRIETNYIE
ncbi:hypothetical protein CL622_04065 [archaeon]|nr:hypothetical protein [archaeon]|tara:strand:+ start:114 stop:566 length:453 start_codon:yes stop_codon:yes gene_type:complete